MGDALALEGIHKRFGATRALDGLDLHVAEGDIHGLLGPNGAGKTTAIRILLGLLRADAGKARLLGGDPWREGPELHRRLAYVPGDVTLWPSLTTLPAPTGASAPSRPASTSRSSRSAGLADAVRSWTRIPVGSK